MKNNGVPTIFDAHRRQLRRLRATRSQDSTKSADYILADMIDDVRDRLDFMQMSEGRAAVLGDLTGRGASELRGRGFTVEEPGPGTLDEEAPWPLPPCDLIVSLGTLDTLNDLPGALLHMRAGLTDRGLYIAQMLGAGSLPVLRQVMLAADADSPAARIHPQVDNRSSAALLQRAGFKSQVVDARSLTVRYSRFETLVGDLRDQALTGVLADYPPPLSKAALARAHAVFDAMREDDGKVTETFQILALTGWR
ncbi:MAG: methyltransferase [Erythrobacter sp.]